MTGRWDGVRVAVAGCGHGTLDALYAAVDTARQAQGWSDVDLFIVGGDFQAVRNSADISVMSVPPKYRQLGDFPAYYRGEKKAPYLTVFVGGNHEASSHLWELYYGGWVAPNIYYLGAANVLRFGPLRIAGMSGIFTDHHYPLTHHERLPFSDRDVRSFYHVREVDVRKLLLLREQVDVGLSHDWPQGIEHHGDAQGLYEIKRHFKKESLDGRLGSPAAAQVMDRLRPAFWFSAHMHCKFASIKKYPPPGAEGAEEGETVAEVSGGQGPILFSVPEQATANPDEIDLDDEDEGPLPASVPEQGVANPDEIDLDDEVEGLLAKQSTQPPDDPSAVQVPPSEATEATEPQSGVTDELRAQLPASFAAPAVQPKPNLTTGQPVPATITNRTTRFLSLDKCLPRRKFVQLTAIRPIDERARPSGPNRTNYILKYDPEWLAITRVFARDLKIGDPAARPPLDLGEAAYRPLIDAERAWVDEHVVGPDRLAVPHNFEITAPPDPPGHKLESDPPHPDEYSNPQTAAFCELLGVPNLWDASPEERAARKAAAPPRSAADNSGGHWGRGGGGGGGGYGRGRGSGRGRGGGGDRGGRGGRGGRGRGRGGRG
ncbi:lariat debranching enzyme, C-terminal domain-containing protein [Nemania sp. NC0429]|nr:lariat debranching enzyme, C-terminal domain-containing protein [Nemania sp. NC0429]